MQPLINHHGRHTSAYVRRRLAEATLLQDQQGTHSWRELEPAPPPVASNSQGAHSLHEGLLGNALRHIQTYMRKETGSLAIGEALETQLHMDDDSLQEETFAPSLEDFQHAYAMQLSQDEREMPTDISAAVLTPKLPWELRPKKSATITFYDADGVLQGLQIVDLAEVMRRSPVLGLAFEESRSGPQLLLETLTARTAERFVLFLNTGWYSPPDDEGNHCNEDVPTSVLLHCELYRLADIYDIQSLKDQAYFNVVRQGEFGCSSPEKPIDLCAAIRFVYAHLEKRERLIDVIINYCVACFLRHRLAEDPEFRQLAHDLRPFHQDLCRNCINRDFENETAAAIIQMPFKQHCPDTYASTEHRRCFDDVVYHFHATDEMDEPKKRKREDQEMTLPIREIPKLAVKTKAGSDGDEPQEYRKRRAPFMVRSGSPVADIKTEEDFETVPLEPPGKSADSDSESFEWVDFVPDLKSTSAAGLALDPGEPTAAAQEKEDESDSDWSLV